MCDVRGLKCSCGNPDFYKKCTPAKDFAPFLKQILDQGAILEGITIRDEFFYSIIGENKHYGTPSNNLHQVVFQEVLVQVLLQV